MLDPQTLAIVAVIFLLAGTIKGVVGFGLPAVGIVLLTFFMELPSAMAVLLLPVFLSNLLQATHGDSLKFLARRLWPFILPALSTVLIGVEALVYFDYRWLVMVLGGVMVFYALVSLAGLKLSLTQAQDRWAAPLIGAINGLVAGMTGVYVAPASLYLQSIGLTKDQLVQALGLYFTLSTIVLTAGLANRAFLTEEIGWLSAFAVAPAVTGMLIGRRIRKGIPEAAFRRVFLTMLCLIGVYLILSRAFGPF